MLLSKGKLSFFSALFFGITSLWAQGYRIEVEVRGAPGDTLILGEHFTSRMVPKDTIVLDENARGVFEGRQALSGGLYIMYLDPDHFFDFLLGDDQDLRIHASRDQLPGSVRFTGSEDNSVFLEYKNYLQQKRGELQQIQSTLNAGSSAADTLAVVERQKEINIQMEAFMDRLEQEHGDLFVSVFVGATREPFPPPSMLTGDRRHDDSVRYFYYRDHYLDRFDPFDLRLLHTPLYEGKIKNYITRAVSQHPDSLMVAVDFLLQGSRDNAELYRYMLITLFNHFAESKFIGMDAVYFHIAEHYYLKDATWSSAEFLSTLEENLAKNKPTLIGQPAPNLIMRRIPEEHFGMAAMDTTIKKDPHIGHDFLIHDIQAPFTILYFWEADCGHCQESTPALHQAYSRLKDQGVEVISVHVINSVEGKEKWVDFVNDHQLFGWINCWSPYSNYFRTIYNLQSYPQLFVLDREKKIVAKRVTPEQAENIINNLLKLES